MAKIEICAYLHGSGGAERQITLLANQMVKRGHEVHFVILAECNYCYPLDERVNIYDLSKEESGNGISRIIKRFKALKRITEKISPDVSVHYWFQSAYFSVIFPHKYRGKVIYAERADPYDKEFNGIVGAIRWVADFFIDGFVFQSEGARDFFSRRIKKRSVVIHNSVNVPQEKYPIPTNREKRIVNIGRLHPQKNQKILIDAFARIADKYLDYRLDIYGDGELKSELLEQIEKLHLEGRVFLCGTTKAIYDKIYKASLFVLSSDYEGIPNALLEAMALGLPCISTDCRPGGARTLINEGVNGFIVPVGDVSSLAERMDYVLSNVDVANNIATNAREIAVTHTDETVFDRWESFLLTVIKK